MKQKSAKRIPVPSVKHDDHWYSHRDTAVMLCGILEKHNKYMGDRYAEAGYDARGYEGEWEDYKLVDWLVEKIDRHCELGGISWSTCLGF